MSAKLLCVEDETDLRSDIVEELVAAGYAVDEAGTGQEALELLRGTRYDLVLCDPPYAYEGLDRLGPALRRLVAPGGLLVYQGPAREQPEIDGLTVRTSRTYGSARLTLFEP